MSSRLQCMVCMRTYPWDSPRIRCECGGLLDAVLPVEKFKDELRPADFDRRFGPGHSPETRSGVWRYRELLFPEEASPRVSRREGDTPLLHQPKLSSWTGVEALYVKVEGENPTGSFKDRGMTVAVSHALETGQTALACASTGNTAASLASYGALAGLPVFVFVPAGKVARGKLSQAVAYGARVLQIAGNFDDALRLVQTTCQELGIALVNSVNPYRVEGQKSAAFEIVHDLGWTPPDWIVLPVGNLGNISAYGKALHELWELGFISWLPRLVGVQATGANPFYRSFREGFVRRHKVQPETVATAIRIGEPASYDRAVRALAWTNGLVEEVNDVEILEAKQVVDRAGIGCEPASAASVAGVRKLRRLGVIQSTDRVVAVLTGHLLKDPDAVLNSWDGENEPILPADSPAEVVRQVETLLDAGKA